MGNTSTPRLGFTSIFIGIRREMINCVDFPQALKTGKVITISCRFLSRWERITAKVSKITHFADGALVNLAPVPGSLLENWKLAPLWIPNVGSCGILTTWESNSEAWARRATA